MEKMNIWSAEEKRDGEGKGGEFLAKENLRSAEEKKKRRKIFGEGKTWPQKEKGENIRRWKK